jgi:UDP-N-acetylglucosamine--N-acetylmuramyl-(pentapeptide) pyrophosphoryl-undecaprenol N-acetylglucosamine transferase
MISRIVFAAGGTGGHIFPAIAVADEIKKMNNAAEIQFIGAKGKMEENIIPKYGYELFTLNIRGFYRSISPKNINVIIKLIRSTGKVKEFLKKFNPQLVFGTGGYVSGPVVRAAYKLGIPAVLYEGNYYPGLTVKALASKAKRVIVNFENSKQYFKLQDNLDVMPYPVRGNLKKYTREEANEFFGLKNDRKTLFAFGGSQGASSINNALLNCAEELISSNIQILWQTGWKEYSTIAEKTGSIHDIKLFKFIENMDYAYSAADLVVCRSGISTMMEAAYFGSAVAFIPYAHASDNHQEKNAKAMVDAEAAEMILDNELDYKFESEILDLMNDNIRLASMKKRITRFADKDAASKIASSLEDIIKSEKN